ncbi:hypothetical protein GCM10008932_00930 [Alkalibacterium iburiense]|uniref:Tetratricopeptide repeat protein n=1 Tax=Alkalibacterium iburiense TaxID=290589 RepID=A0ABP3GPI5_9LACT
MTWQKVWNQIKRIMDKNEIETIEELDEVFDGTQTIYNWSTDFSQELLNMSRQKKDFLQNRLTFYTEYLERTADLSEDNAKTMKADLAQTYFEIGQAQKGEKLFQELTTDYPTWGWGWIFWSDVYGVFAEDTDKDFNRALKILNEALTVKGLEDKEDIRDRMELTKKEMKKE